MNHRLLTSATRVALATAGLILATGPVLSQSVGKTAAVNPTSTASGRTLTLGSEIIHKERIKTSDSGSLQLMFLDRSTMNIGPNSDVVIDEYVYDPNSNTGKMSVSIGKGLMRFVGGQISHDGNATVKTPSATMGIRGAVGSFSYDPGSGLTSASNDCKDCSITLTAPNGKTVTIPPGYTATVSGGNISLAPTTQDQANKNLKGTGSKGGQTGGADSKTSKDAANKDGDVAQNSQGDGNKIDDGLTTNLPPTPAPVPNFTPFALTMNGGCCNNVAGNVPFLHPNLDTNQTDTLISPVIGVRADSAATGAADGKFIQYSSFLGNTAHPQDHWMLVAVGGLRSDGQGGTTVDGGFAGTGSGPDHSAPGSTQGSLSSTAAQVTTDANRLPTGMTVTNGNTSSSYVQGDTASSDTPTTFTYTQDAASTTVPTGLGATRPAVVLQGYVGGVARSEQIAGSGSATSFFVIGNVTNDPSNFSLTLDPSDSSVTANMNIKNKSGGGTPRFDTASLNFGGNVLVTDPTRSAYIDYDNFAALDQRNTNGTPTSTIDGLPITSSDGFLIVATPAIQQQVATKLGITPCQCDYTRWGFWSMTSKQTTGGSNTFDDRNHMNLWVAGRPTKETDIPTTGSATYNGHIVANVQDGNGLRIAGGNFTNTVNFGSGLIDTNASLDGASFVKNGALAISGTDRRNFSGSILDATTQRTMSMDGSFFQGKLSKYGEMGGSVNVTGTNYIAGGIFAGKKTP